MASVGIFWLKKEFQAFVMGAQAVRFGKLMAGISW